MTVAPKMPTAMIRCGHGFNGKDSNFLTCIQAAALENIFRRKVTLERVSPVNIYLGDDDAHAYHDSEDLRKI
jgi:hypothetical protein